MNRKRRFNSSLRMVVYSHLLKCSWKHTQRKEYTSKIYSSMNFPNCAHLCNEHPESLLMSLFSLSTVTEPNLALLPPAPPARSKASLLTCSCCEGKCSIYFRAPSKEYRWLMLKRPELPGGFQGKVFEDRVRERIAGCIISLWTFFWLVGGEVIRSQHHQLSGSTNWSR